jgi:hypothetical protein
MSEYTYNDDKPSALLTGYSTVRGAELKEIYEVLATQGQVPVSAFDDRFARPDSQSGRLNTSHIDNCMKFLRSVDMVQVSAQDMVSPVNQDVHPEIESVEARLLHHIRQQEGKNYHLSYIFDVVIDRDTRRLTIEELEEYVEEDDTRSFGFTWTAEKLRMWANLADHLGAITYADGGDKNEVVVSPTRRLLVDLLSWYSENGEDSNRFARAMEWIHRDFLPVFANPHKSTVAIGVADVLNDMQDDDILTMQSMSDTADVVEVPRTKNDSRGVSTFEIETPPERPSYWYPLDRSERRFES